MKLKFDTVDRYSGFYSFLLQFNISNIKIIFVSIMRKIDKLKKRFNNYRYDHVKLFIGMNMTWSGLCAVLAAAFYAFAFYCFITPFVIDHATIDGSSIITGGVGGISQVITLILEVCGVPADPYMIQSIFYVVLNVPIMIFAFFKVGKKFTLFTLINVGLSSLFIQLFNNVGFTKQIAEALVNESHLTRVLFAGVVVGTGSAIAYKGGVSCGGIDVFSYYLSNKNSTSVGKYAATLNATIILVYTILTIIVNKGELVHIALLNLAYSIVYIFVNMSMVDLINTKNKKVQLQIITNHADMSSILIANFPHGTTLLNAWGGYTHGEKTVIYMTISSNEVRKVVSLVRKADEHSFISVYPLIQAYGNFFIKPVE